MDTPPEVLDTDEMRQAMEVLNRFSENQDDYLRYQSRLNAILKENTYVNEIARVKREKEQVQAQLDSLLLQLKERGMDDVVSEVFKAK